VGRCMVSFHVQDWAVASDLTNVAPEI
jgi:hypothetical protein